MGQLVLVLGDQLNLQGAALAAADPQRDIVLMVETLGEARHVPSHRQRVVLFLSAMRHFRDGLRARGWTVDYRDLAAGAPDLAAGIGAALAAHRPERLLVTEPGEWRVAEAVTAAAAAAAVPLTVLPDDHFFCTREEFQGFAAGRRQLVMEHFYRHLRRRHRILMEGNQPAGGAWNFDRENRGSFGRDGPGALPAPRRFPPDDTTRGVMAEVAAALPDHPGELDTFGWPVTRDQSLVALDDFLRHRLPQFGRYQDALWAGEPFLYHSLLSASLNLKFLNPREVVAAAEAEWRAGRVPLAAAEGFIRQILGWREYVRGVYWLHMPGYAALNHFGHHRALPAWFWTGETPMNCLRQSIGDTFRNGYAHHIQRLMVIGNFALLAGLEPREVCRWFLAVYVDAVEWAELPNTLGMALHGDGGLMATKPYMASGQYIKRMSNYCTDCRFDPAQRTGPGACPFTVLYWDFLARHRPALARNRRLQPALGNLDRLGPEMLASISRQAGDILERLPGTSDLT